MKKIIAPLNDRRQFLKSSASAAILAPTGLLLSDHSFAQKDQTPPTKLAPELNVPYWIDGNGNESNPFTIAANEGKWVFLKCFQNWCPGCHASGFPTLRKLVKTFGTDHEQIAFAAIQTTFEGHYTNNKEALRPLQLRYETPIPYGHDAGNQKLSRDEPEHYPNTMYNYGTRGTPWLIIVAPNRKIMYSNFHINVDALVDFFKAEFA